MKEDLLVFPELLQGLAQVGVHQMDGLINQPRPRIQRNKCKTRSHLSEMVLRMWFLLVSRSLVLGSEVPITRILRNLPE